MGPFFQRGALHAIKEYDASIVCPKVGLGNPTQKKSLLLTMTSKGQHNTSSAPTMVNLGALLLALGMY